MAPKKKPGKPSDFVGKRAEFLNTFYPTYEDASNRGATRPIWKKFFRSYWAEFPWRLPLTQDPDPNDPADYALDPQNTEETAEKAKVMPKIEKVNDARGLERLYRLTGRAENQMVVGAARKG
jgi:hypothetical protein